jgi:hypothetical protein
MRKAVIKAYKVRVNEPFDCSGRKSLVTVDDWLVFFGLRLEVVGDHRLGVLVSGLLFALLRIVGQHGFEVVFFTPFSVLPLDINLINKTNQENKK